MNNKLFLEIYNIERDHWWFVGRRKIIERFLRRYAPQPAHRALDIGCGTGFQAQLLKKVAKEVIGLDPSDSAIELAERLDPQFSVIKGEFPGFKTREKYDIITLFDVLEHIEDDGLALREIADMLNPGGIALITVPAFQFLWSAHDNLAHHKRRYAIPSLRAAVCSHTNLEIARISYFNFLLFFPIFFFRSLKTAFHFGKGSSDLFAVPHVINRALTGVFSLESRMLRWFNPPFGVSIICALKKTEREDFSCR